MELLMESRETPPDMVSLARDNLTRSGSSHTGEGDQVTVRLVTVKGIQEVSERHQIHSWAGWISTWRVRATVRGSHRTVHGQSGDTSGHVHSGQGQPWSNKQSSHTHAHFGKRHSTSQISGRQRHRSDQAWRHGSYGSAEYDYGQSGYGPSWW